MRYRAKYDTVKIISNGRLESEVAKRQSMPIIKGFFFDLDDTLVGTKEANFHAYKEALADAGITFSYDDFLRTWGED